MNVTEELVQICQGGVLKYKEARILTSGEWWKWAHTLNDDARKEAEGIYWLLRSIMDAIDEGYEADVHDPEMLEELRKFARSQGLYE